MYTVWPNCCTWSRDLFWTCTLYDLTVVRLNCCTVKSSFETVGSFYVSFCWILFSSVYYEDIIKEICSLNSVLHLHKIMLYKKRRDMDVIYIQSRWWRHWHDSFQAFFSAALVRRLSFMAHVHSLSIYPGTDPTLSVEGDGVRIKKKEGILYHLLLGLQFEISDDSKDSVGRRWVMYALLATRQDVGVMILVQH